MASIPPSPLIRFNPDGTDSILSAADTLPYPEEEHVAPVPSSPNISDKCPDCQCANYPNCSNPIEDVPEEDSDDSDSYATRLNKAECNAEVCETCVYGGSGAHKSKEQMDYGLSEGDGDSRESDSESSDYDPVCPICSCHNFPKCLTTAGQSQCCADCLEKIEPEFRAACLDVESKSPYSKTLRRAFAKLVNERAAKRAKQ